MERLDRQAAFSGTRQAEGALAIDGARLDATLQRLIPGYQGPSKATLFKGGQSNPTYLIEAASGAYVLRRKPPGPLLPSAHQIEREARVMTALGTVGFPVPRIHGLVDDPGVIGSAFYVMDKVEGEVVWEPHMPAATVNQRRATYAAMNATLARLHTFDPGALGLGDFGRAEGYVARQVKRWSQQYAVSATEDIPAMDRLIAWLPDHLPPAGPAAIVHGDFRLDNLILAPDGQVRAVLDWELATLGDPIADFAYHLMQWIMPPTDDGSGTGSLVGHDLAALGIPDQAAYVRAYEDATGFEVAPHLNRLFAYNLFRLAAILQGIVGRVRDGTATNPNAAAMAKQVRPLAEAGWRYAQGV